MEFCLGLIGSALYSLLVFNGKSHYPRLAPTCYPFMYRGMIMLPLNYKMSLHVHHWLVYLVLLFFNVPKIVKGFAFGMMVQGLLYDDCFDFIDKNYYNE